MPSPVFISYARGASLADAQALKAALGHLAFLDTSGIDDGDQFQQQLLTHLLNSSVVVIFATGLFLERRYCRLEMRLALAGAASIVLALGERFSEVLVTLPTNVTGNNWPQANETSRLQKLVEKLLASNPPAINQLLTVNEAQRIGKAFLEESKLPLPQPLPSKHSFPPGVASSSIGTRFVGRADLLPAIHSALSDGIGKSARLTGRIVAGGGFGKTRAAIEYLHRYASHYPGGIFWLDASNPDLPNEFWRILKELNPAVPDLLAMREQNRNVALELGHALHSIGQSALYVVDNILEAAPGESPKPIGHFCPAIGAVAVLATSRQNNTEPGTIPVDPLERDPAILLLTNGVPASATLAWDDWGRIASIVGDLPIALDLLNRCLVLSAITPANLLQKLQQPSPVAELDRLSQALKGQVPEGAARGVTEAFLISYQLLDPTSQRLAQLLAQLEPSPIPEVFMEALPDELKNARAAMRSRHFVTASDPPNALSFGVMHRLMADFLRNLFSPDDVKLLDDACSVLSKTMDSDLCQNPQHWPAMILCRPHAMALFHRSEGTKASADLALRAAILAHAQGDLPAARQLGERVLAVMTRVLGEEHPDTLRSMNNLAETLRAQGDLPAARQLGEQVLEVRTRVLGEEHPDTLTSMGNLAVTLKAQGDLPAARQLQERVLAVRTRVLGEEHPATMTSMNNLAETLRAQGDLPAARQLQERVLAVMTRVLGEEHPATLTSMNNLASTLMAQGDLPAARQLQERVLAVSTRVLGEEHPDTLTSMNNLAETLWAQGDLPAARKLGERVLAVRTRVLGQEHPVTLTSMNNLAATLRAQGNLLAARQLQERVLAVRTRVLGEEHPATLRSMNNLAETLSAQGDLPAARQLEERGLAVTTRVLGEEHPATLTSMNNLASTLMAQGDLPAARQLEERVLAVMTRVLGEEHPDTLSSMNNLAVTLFYMKDRDGAIGLLRKCLLGQRKVLGDKHPDTVSTAQSLKIAEGR